MSDVLIRNLDENVIIRLIEQAKHAGQSLNMLLKIVLTKEAMRAPRRDVAQELANLRALPTRVTSTGATQPSSVDILRGLRDGEDQRI